MDTEAEPTSPAYTQALSPAVRRVSFRSPHRPRGFPRTAHSRPAGTETAASRETGSSPSAEWSFSAAEPASRPAVRRRPKGKAEPQPAGETKIPLSYKTKSLLTRSAEKLRTSISGHIPTRKRRIARSFSDTRNSFLLLGVVCIPALLLLILLPLFGGAAVLYSSSEETSCLNQTVLNYRETVFLYASDYGIIDYVDLSLAVMMQESGGSGTDPMQSSACGYNTLYAGGIEDPVYSIDCGIHYLADCLLAAGVESPQDLTHISLALQGYNYGIGYITWAQDRDGGYTAENAAAYSALMRSRYGYSVYGDPQYVSHVLRYYNYGTSLSSVSGSLLVEIALSQVGNEGGELYWRWYGFDSHVSWCACFISWCANEAGLSDSEAVPRYAECSEGMQIYRDAGRWVSSSGVPSVGDTVFFDWDHDGSPDHVGLVTGMDDTYLYTVEGNSSDAVRQRSYLRTSSSILGFGSLSGI